MKMYIDGYVITAEPGITLLNLIKSLNLDSESFSNRPIAAKIAGEVFNLDTGKHVATVSGRKREQK